MVFVTCMVYGCVSTSYKNKDLRFFRLPTADERRHLWILACKREDLIGKNETTLKHKCVCSLHFEEYMFSKKNLKKTATPTLNLPATPTFSVSTQTASPKIVVVRTLQNQGVQSTVETSSKEQQTEDRPSTSFSDYTCKTQAFLTADHTPRKRHLRQLSQYSANKLKIVEIKIDDVNDITLDQFFQGCDKFLDPQMSAIVKAQVNLRQQSHENTFT